MSTRPWGLSGTATTCAKSADMSARRLGVDRIDLYYLHSGYAEDAPFEEQVETLAELRDQGLIRNIGLSNVTADQFRSAQAIVEIAAVTAHYNVAVRAGSELLRAAEAASVAFSPWHPATVHAPDTPPFVKERVQTIARRYDATPRQVALAWQLGRSPLTLPIPGTTRLAHLRENLAAERIHLTPGEIDSITALTAEAS
jgi:pyridoxine 4-dehydrogenase